MDPCWSSERGTLELGWGQEGGGREGDVLGGLEVIMTFAGETSEFHS